MLTQILASIRARTLGKFLFEPSKKNRSACPDVLFRVGIMDIDQPHVEERRVTRGSLRETGEHLLVFLQRASKITLGEEILSAPQLGVLLLSPV